jgi:hypothetical protein
MKQTEVLKIDEQFAFFSAMTPMVQHGALAFPRQVARELSRAQYPDTPGAWATGVKGLVIYPDPSDESLAEVLGAAQLIDANGDDDYAEADPYLVAMAYDIQQHYADSHVIVVSDDVKDRMPRKESVLTACNRLEIKCIGASDFVDYLRTSIIRKP